MENPMENKRKTLEHKKNWSKNKNGEHHKKSRIVKEAKEIKAENV